MLQCRSSTSGNCLNAWKRWYLLKIKEKDCLSYLKTIQYFSLRLSGFNSQSIQDLFVREIPIMKLPILSLEESRRSFNRNLWRNPECNPWKNRGVSLKEFQMESLRVSYRNSWKNPRRILDRNLWKALRRNPCKNPRRYHQRKSGENKWRIPWNNLGEILEGIRTWISKNRIGWMLKYCVILKMCSSKVLF